MISKLGAQNFRVKSGSFLKFSEFLIELGISESLRTLCCYLIRFKHVTSKVVYIFSVLCFFNRGFSGVYHIFVNLEFILKSSPVYTNFLESI